MQMILIFCFMRVFNNRENADTIMLSFKGITELYIDYAQLAFFFLKTAQEKKNRKEIFQNIKC